MTPAQMRAIMRQRAYGILAIPLLIFVIYQSQHGGGWGEIAAVTVGAVTVAYGVAYILYPGD